jgi:hypothetical protein
MTKKLESLFNLPAEVAEDVTAEQAVTAAEAQQAVFDDVNNPPIKDVCSHESDG